MHTQEIAWLLHEKYNGQKTAGFLADCARLEAGEPLAYIIGYTPFLNCTIHLDHHPLIPRPETEYWTELAIAAIAQAGIAAPHVLDLCAGSGAIGVAVARAIPTSQVTFAEINPTLISTIEKNIASNLTADHATIPAQHHTIVSDLFSHVTDTFDFILTNPPYIDAAANTVDADVVAHEPHQALFGGKVGMEIITRIITDAPNHLTPTGQLWIEHEPAQSVRINELAARHGWHTTTYQDQYHTERYSILTRNMPK